MSNRLGTAATTLALFGGMLAVASSADATFPGQNGKIAFSRSSPSSAQIYSVNPDGTGDGKISSTAGAIDDHPAWSPDGRRIAFTSYRSFSGAAIYVMNADGSGARMLVDGGEHPAWSPDGSKILLTSISGMIGGNIDIWVINVDGHALTRLTDHPAIDIYPTWSPDGQKIAFASNRTNYAIWTMNANGSNETLIGGPNGNEPSWSPDGTKIAFSGYDGSNQVWVMNADGTNQLKITNGLVSYSPSWSPDGTKIAFVRDLDPGFAFNEVIHVMNVDGTGITQVASGVAKWPDWQPRPAVGSSAAYEVPYEAPSVRAALVPVFRQCGSGGNPVNAGHSPPLGTGSCSPPTPGSVARFGPQSTGSAELAVFYGASLSGDQADVIIRLSLKDVQTGLGADYDPDPVGPDSTLITRLRFTDTSNGGSGTDPGTATDFDFSLPVTCNATTDASLGSTCSLDTTADSVMPGVIKENVATVLQTFRFRLNDSGANGVPGDSDDRIFATQGIFVP
jgi:TolB protein